MSVLRGFNAGYNAMNQYYGQQESKRRYDQQYERQLTNDGMRQEAHNLQMGNGALNQQILQNNVDQIPTMNERADTQFENQQTVSGLRIKTLQDQVDRIPIMNERQDKAYDQQNTLSGLNIENAKMQNQLSKNQMAMQKLQILATSGRGGQEIFDPEFDNTNAALLRDERAREAANYLNEKFDAGDFTNIQQPLNVLFGPQVKKGVGGTGKDGYEITDKELVNIRMIQGPDGREFLEADLKVTTKGGAYSAPLSEFRSSNPNDPAAKIDLQKAFGTVGALSDFAKLMDQQSTQRNIQTALTPAAKQSKPDWKSVESEFGSTMGYFDPNTGKYVEVPQSARAPGMSEESLNKENEILAKQAETRITMLSQELLPAINALGAELSDSDKQSIARRAAIKIQEATNAGVSIDEPALIKQATSEFIEIQEQKSLERKQNFDKALSASQTPMVDPLSRGIY